jgi:hypothetical protein
MANKLSKLANGLPLTYDYIDQIVDSLNKISDRLDARSGVKIPRFFGAGNATPTTKTPIVSVGQETFQMTGTGADESKFIKFNVKFEGKPIVVATVNQLDERSGQPINAYCTVCKVNGSSFYAKVFYQSDTTPRNIILNYIAIGFKSDS